MGTGIVVIGGVAAVVLLPRSPAGTLSCVDVAQEVGLVFQNDPGPTVAENENQLIMLRNMGNGAAVGRLRPGR